jgi:hypothetical protein
MVVDNLVLALGGGFRTCLVGRTTLPLTDVRFGMGASGASDSSPGTTNFTLRVLLLVRFTWQIPVSEGVFIFSDIALSPNLISNSRLPGGFDITSGN